MHTSNLCWRPAARWSGRILTLAELIGRDVVELDLVRDAPRADLPSDDGDLEAGEKAARVVGARGLQLGPRRPLGVLPTAARWAAKEIGVAHRNSI